MGDKGKVLQETGEAYRELREAVSGLDEAQVRAVWLGTWGVREILIQISAWRLGRWYEAGAAFPVLLLRPNLTEEERALTLEAFRPMLQSA
jgi:hypothetical protein